MPPTTADLRLDVFDHNVHTRCIIPVRTTRVHMALTLTVCIIFGKRSLHLLVFLSMLCVYKHMYTYTHTALL